MTSLPPFNLLVIDYNQSENSNWYKLFHNKVTQSGRKIHVEQAGWEEIKLVSNSHFGPLLELKGKGSESMFMQQKEDRKMVPDFVLVRNFPSALHTESYRNVLLGLMFASKFLLCDVGLIGGGRCTCCEFVGFHLHVQ